MNTLRTSVAAIVDRHRLHPRSPLPPSECDPGAILLELQIALDAPEAPKSKAIHAPRLRDEVLKNLRVVIDKAKKGERLTDGYGMPISESHNVVAGLDQLAQFAGHWEVYCRDNGLNPYSGRPGSMHPSTKGWEGFERAASSDEWNASLRSREGVE